MVDLVVGLDERIPVLNKYFVMLPDGLEGPERAAVIALEGQDVRMAEVRVGGEELVVGHLNSEKSSWRFPSGLLVAKQPVPRFELHPCFKTGFVVFA